MHYYCQRNAIFSRVKTKQYKKYINYCLKHQSICLRKLNKINSYQRNPISECSAAPIGFKVQNKSFVRPPGKSDNYVSNGNIVRQHTAEC